MENYLGPYAAERTSVEFIAPPVQEFAPCGIVHHHDAQIARGDAGFSQRDKFRDRVVFAIARAPLERDEQRAPDVDLAVLGKLCPVSASGGRPEIYLSSKTKTQILALDTELASNSLSERFSGFFAGLNLKARTQCRWSMRWFRLE